MKILLISPTPPPIGGMSIWTMNYLDYFKKEHDVKLIDTSMLTENTQNTSIAAEIKREFLFFINCLKIKKCDFELVHFNSPLDNIGILKDYLAIKLLKKKGLNIVLQIHSDVTAQLKWRISKSIFKQMIKICDEVIALNDNTCSEVLKTRKNVKKIPNFINSGLMNQYVKETQNQTIKNICYVGRFNEEKGSKEFLEIAKILSDTSFHILGPDEQKEKNELKNVFYYGNLDQQELFEKMSCCDLMLFLSHHEGSPLSIIESSFLNLPIISSDVGNISEMISSMCIVDYNKIDEIINKIKQFNDINVRNKTVKYNKSIANNNTIENVSKELIQIYRKVVQRNKLI